MPSAVQNYALRNKYKDQLITEDDDNGSVVDNIYVFQRNESCNQVGFFITFLIALGVLIVFCILGFIFSFLWKGVPYRGTLESEYITRATSSFFVLPMLSNISQPIDMVTRARVDPETLRVAVGDTADTNFALALAKTSWLPVVGIFLTFVFALGCIAFMSKCAKCIVWSLYIGGILLIVLAGIGSIIFGIVVHTKSKQSGIPAKETVIVLILIGIVLFLVSACACCALACCIDRIRLVIALIKEAALATIQIPCAVIVPCTNASLSFVYLHLGRILLLRLHTSGNCCNVWRLVLHC
ncbi:hypothetical protein BLNAU_11504 [Blattamonas nauphoetae]|uniref:Uncharacterized protein n=1 Tax=Blattamonas nauphoetae TaxID=2049346 RepID=A0ABQ9XPQ5_9EUKA|nr:hypothetical protein BLNAU_11504 [Blattamonas nauphoetae]